MNVMISINGNITHLSAIEQGALRQACAMEMHRYLKRRDNTRTVHIQEQHMNQALFLERIANALVEGIKPVSG